MSNMTTWIARRLGFVPRADLDAEKSAHQESANEARAEVFNLKALMDRRMAKANQQRLAARALFQQGFEMGVQPECIADGSGCDHLGNIVTTGCRKGCSTAKPKCAYNIAKSGLDVTRHQVF